MMSSTHTTPTAAPSVARLVWRFAAAGLVALASVGLASVVVSRNVGRDLALAEAERIGRLTGTGIVEPAIEPGVLDGDPQALQELNDVVVEAVLEGSLVRVKLWQPDGSVGRVVYSDESRLIGEEFPLPQDKQEALTTGESVIEETDLDAPENRYEAESVALLEVYVPITGPSGDPLLYEAYFRLDRVQEAGRQVWLALAPLGIGALLILQLVQVPLAWSLARRLREQSLARERMLQQSIESSARERRRIAADLHDGVVQELAGISYTLSAAATAAPEDARQAAAASGRQLRSAVGSLRALLVDIYPPDLGSEGLEAALEDLFARQRSAGLEVRLDSQLTRDMPLTVAELLYRTANEALRNIAKHADATQVDVRLQQSGRGVCLTIEDDGRGFAVDQLKAPDDHFGFRLLADIAADLGARLQVDSAPEAGTLLTLDIPLEEP